MSLLSKSPARPRHAIARGKRFVLIASEFNRPISLRLVKAASAELRRAGASPADIRVFWVPGAFELPVAAAKAVQARPRPDAVLALGCLVRGETMQYEVLGHAVAQGLTQVAVSAQIPVTFGVIVAETAAQARSRAGGRQGNRGAEAAHAALAVLSLFERLT